EILRLGGEERRQDVRVPHLAEREGERLQRRIGRGGVRHCAGDGAHGGAQPSQGGARAVHDLHGQLGADPQDPVERPTGVLADVDGERPVPVAHPGASTYSCSAVPPSAAAVSSITVSSTATTARRRSGSSCSSPCWMTKGSGASTRIAPCIR